MPFNSTNLSVLAYANNFTLWHYTTVDSLDTVRNTGYFNSASDMLRVNDMIITNADTTNTNVTQFLIVTGNKDGQVSVAPFTA